MKQYHMSLSGFFQNHIKMLGIKEHKTQKLTKLTIYMLNTIINFKLIQNFFFKQPLKSVC